MEGGFHHNLRELGEFFSFGAWKGQLIGAADSVAVLGPVHLCPRGTWSSVCWDLSVWG